jgi:GNAT superfamily N-acetyltransferase
MYVHPDWPGQGLGKLTLRHVMQRGADRGLKTITLDTETSIGAYHLYREHGFQFSEGNTVFIQRRSP